MLGSAEAWSWGLWGMATSLCVPLQVGVLFPVSASYGFKLQAPLPIASEAPQCSCSLGRELGTEEVMKWGKIFTVISLTDIRLIYREPKLSRGAGKFTASRGRGSPCPAPWLSAVPCIATFSRIPSQQFSLLFYVEESKSLSFPQILSSVDKLTLLH